MWKVDLIYRNSTFNTTVEEKIKDLYLGFDAKVLNKGEDDKVYWVKNFPKDSYYIIQESDKLSDICNMGFNVDEEAVYPYNVLIQKKNIGKIYTVQPLDTLTTICSKLNIDEESLISKNKLKGKKLFIGQQLVIDI